MIRLVKRKKITNWNSKNHDDRKISFFEANKVIEKKINERIFKSKAGKDAEFSAILKSQVEEKVKLLLKAISEAILNRNDDSDGFIVLLL